MGRPGMYPSWAHAIAHTAAVVGLTLMAFAMCAGVGP